MSAGSTHKGVSHPCHSEIPCRRKTGQLTIITRGCNAAIEIAIDQQFQTSRQNAEITVGSFNTAMAINLTCTGTRGPTCDPGPENCIFCKLGMYFL